MENIPSTNRLYGHLTVLLGGVLCTAPAYLYKKFKQLSDGYDELVIESINDTMKREDIDESKKIEDIGLIVTVNVKDLATPKQIRARIKCIISATRAGKEEAKIPELEGRILSKVQDNIILEEAVKRATQIMDMPRSIGQRRMMIALLLGNEFEHHVDPAVFISKVEAHVVQSGPEEEKKEKKAVFENVGKMAEDYNVLKKSMQCWAKGEVFVKEIEEEKGGKIMRMVDAEKESLAAFGHLFQGYDYMPRRTWYRLLRESMENDIADDPSKSKIIRKLDDMWKEQKLSVDDKICILDELACKKNIPPKKIIEVMKSTLQNELEDYPEKMREAMKAIVGASKNPAVLDSEFSKLLEQAEDEVVIEKAQRRIKDSLQACVADRESPEKVAAHEDALVKTLVECNTSTYDESKQRAGIEKILTHPLKVLQREPNGEIASATATRASKKAIDELRIQQLAKVFIDPSISKIEKNRIAASLLNSIILGVEPQKRRAMHASIKGRVLEGDLNPKLKEKIAKELRELWHAIPYKVEDQIEMGKAIMADEGLPKAKKDKALATILNSPFEKDTVKNMRERVRMIVQGIRKAMPGAPNTLEEVGDDVVCEKSSRKMLEAMENPANDSKAKETALINALADATEAIPKKAQEKMFEKIGNSTMAKLNEEEKEEIGKSWERLFLQGEIEAEAYEILKLLQEASTPERGLRIQKLLDEMTKRYGADQRDLGYAKLKRAVMAKAPAGFAAKFGRELEDIWSNRKLSDNDLLYRTFQLFHRGNITPEMMHSEIPQFVLQGTESLPANEMQQRTDWLIRNAKYKNPSQALEKELDKIVPEVMLEYNSRNMKKLLLDKDLPEHEKLQRLQQIYVPIIRGMHEEEKSRQVVSEVFDKAARGTGIEKKKHLRSTAEAAYWILKLTETLENKKGMPQGELVLAIKEHLDNAMKGYGVKKMKPRFDFLEREVITNTEEKDKANHSAILKEAWNARKISNEDQPEVIADIMESKDLTDDQKKKDIIIILRKNNEGLSPAKIKTRIRMVMQALRKKGVSGKVLDNSAKEALAEEVEKAAMEAVANKGTSEEEKKDKIASAIYEVTAGLPEDEQIAEFSKCMKKTLSNLKPEEQKEIGEGFLNEVEQAWKTKTADNELIDTLLDEKKSPKTKKETAQRFIEKALVGVKLRQQRELYDKMKTGVLKNAPSEGASKVSSILDEAFEERKLTAEDFAAMLGEIEEDKEVDEKAKKEKVKEIMLLEGGKITPSQMRERIKLTIAALRAKHKGEGKEEKMLNESSKDIMQALASQRIAGAVNEKDIPEKERKNRVKDIVSQFYGDLKEEERNKELTELTNGLEKVLPKDKLPQAVELVRYGGRKIKEEKILGALKASLLNKALTDAKRINECEPMLQELMADLPYEEKKIKVEEIEDEMSAGANRDEKKRIKDSLHLVWRRRKLTPDEQEKMIEEHLRNPKANKKEKIEMIKEVYLSNTEKITPKELKQRNRALIAALANRKDISTSDNEKCLRDGADEAVCEHSAKRIRSIAKEPTIPEKEKAAQAKGIMKEVIEGEKEKAPLVGKIIECSLANTTLEERPHVERIVRSAAQQMKVDEITAELPKILTNQEISEKEKEKAIGDSLALVMADVPFKDEKAQIEKMKTSILEALPEASRAGMPEKIEAVWNAIPYEDKALARVVNEIVDEKPSKNPEEMKKDVKSVFSRGSKKMPSKTIRGKAKYLVKALQDSGKKNPKINKLIEDTGEEIITERAANEAIRVATYKDMDDKKKPEQLKLLLNEAVEDLPDEQAKKDLQIIIDSASKTCPAEAKVPMTDALSAASDDIINERRAAPIRRAALNPGNEGMEAIQEAVDAATKDVPIEKKREAFNKLVGNTLKGLSEKDQSAIGEMMREAWIRRYIPEADQPKAVEEVLRQPDATRAQKAKEIQAILIKSNQRFPLKEIKSRIKAISSAFSKGRKDETTHLFDEALEGVLMEIRCDEYLKSMKEIMENEKLSDEKKKPILIGILTEMKEGLTPEQQKLEQQKMSYDLCAAFPAKTELIKAAEEGASQSMEVLEKAEAKPKKDADVSMTISCLQNQKSTDSEKRQELEKVLEESSKGLKGKERRERIRMMVAAIRKGIPESDAAKLALLLNQSYESALYKDAEAAAKLPNEKQKNETLYTAMTDIMEGLPEKEQEEELKKLKATVLSGYSKEALDANEALLEYMFLMYKIRYVLKSEDITEEQRNSQLQILLAKLSKGLTPETFGYMYEMIKRDVLNGLTTKQQAIIRKRMERIQIVFVTARKEYEEEIKLRYSEEEKKGRELRTKTVKSEYVVEEKHFDPTGPVTSYDELDLAVAAKRELVVYGREVLDVATFKSKHPGSPDLISSLVGREISRYVSGCRALKGKDHLHSDAFGKEMTQLKVSTIKDDINEKAFSFAKPDSTLESLEWKFAGKKPVTGSYFLVKLSNPDVTISSLVSEGEHFGKYFIVTSKSKNISTEAVLIHCFQRQIDEKMNELEKAVKNGTEYEQEFLKSDTKVNGELWLLFESKGKVGEWLAGLDEKTYEAFTLAGPYVRLID